MTTFTRTYDGRYRCANCFIFSSVPLPQCPFCKSIVTNYEFLLIENEQEKYLTSYQNYGIMNIESEEGENHETN